MATAKIAISIEAGLLGKIDRLIREKVFPSRSKVIQASVKEKLEKIEKRRLYTECAKLDPAFEQSLAEEGLGKDIETWPEY